MHGNQAYFLGRADRREGKGLWACPFAEGSYQAIEYRRGWDEVDAAGAVPVDPTLELHIERKPDPVPVAAPPPKPRYTPSFRTVPILWDADQDEMLERLWRGDVPVADIAMKMRRSKSSITSRASRIGLPDRRASAVAGKVVERQPAPNNPSKRRWTRRATDRLRELYAEPGADVHAIARKLRRSPKAIYNKAAEMNLPRIGGAW